MSGEVETSQAELDLVDLVVSLNFCKLMDR
jgi:hypothetical protein